VTPQVFQFIGPSNDGRRHGRGTYLLIINVRNQMIIPLIQAKYAKIKLAVGKEGADKKLQQSAYVSFVTQLKEIPQLAKMTFTTFTSAVQEKADSEQEGASGPPPAQAGAVGGDGVASQTTRETEEGTRK
jgi:hypothetical protein